METELRNEFNSIIENFNKNLDEFFEKNNLCKYYSFFIELDNDSDVPKMKRETPNGTEIMKNIGFREDITYRFEPHRLTRIN